MEISHKIFNGIWWNIWWAIVIYKSHDAQLSIADKGPADSSSGILFDTVMCTNSLLPRWPGGHLGHPPATFPTTTMITNRVDSLMNPLLLVTKGIVIWLSIHTRRYTRRLNKPFWKKHGDYIVPINRVSHDIKHGLLAKRSWLAMH